MKTQADMRGPPHANKRAPTEVPSRAGANVHPEEASRGLAQGGRRAQFTTRTLN